MAARPKPTPTPPPKPTPTAPDRALSIAEPWAYLIAAGFKQLENRTWRTDYRGPLAIHASKTRRNMYDEDGMLEICDMHPAIYPALDDERITDETPLFQFGAIIGIVDVVDCVAFDPATDDPDALFTRYNALAADGPAPELPVAAWAEGPYCFVLANARRFAKPITCAGKLSLWSLSPELRQAVAAAGRFLLTEPGQPPKPPKPPADAGAAGAAAPPADRKAEQRREAGRDRRRQKLIGQPLPRK